MQDSVEHLTSQVSSSGGGLPGRLDLNRDRGARYLGQSFLRDVVSSEWIQVFGLGIGDQGFVRIAGLAPAKSTSVMAMFQQVSTLEKIIGLLEK